MGAPKIPAEEAFIVTVGVPRHNRNMFCERALRVLRQYGFRVGATSNESLIQLGVQAELVNQLQENDPA